MATPKKRAAHPPDDTRATSPAPPDNQPGHHPPVEQDKPTSPPPTAVRSVAPAARSDLERFPFEFSLRLAPAAAAFGVVPPAAHVDVGDSELHVRFGPWSLRTPLTNVRSVTRSGPYRWWKVGGPARVSLMDRGVTFATTTRQGVCIAFREPVAAALPVPLIRHPAATVTVADADGLVAAIARRVDLED